MTRDECIAVVHRRACPARPKGSTAKCRCDPSYRVQVWDDRRRELVRKTFRDLASARTWRDDVRVALRHGGIRRPTRTTVQNAADELLAGMRAGTIRARGGRPYKPATIRSYERALRLQVLRELGALALSDVRRADVQALVDRLAAEGASRSTIDNALDPLRVIVDRAIKRDELDRAPTDHIDLPADDAKVRESVDVDTGKALVAAAPERDRALWALAFYCALRRGELRALRVSDVELKMEGDKLVGVVHVRHGWDDDEGEIDAKSAAGKRDVPLMGPTAGLVNARILAAKRAGDDLLLGTTSSTPFDPSTVQARADKAWKAAGLPRVTLHGLRKSGWNWLRQVPDMTPYQLRAIFGHSGRTDSGTLYGAIHEAELDAIRERADAFLGAGS